MATLNQLLQSTSDPGVKLRAVIRKRVPFVCNWQHDLDDAGVEHRGSPLFSFGVPVIALVALLVMAIAALLVQDQGGPTIWSLLLIAVAAIPWAQWLVLGDNGPRLSFGVMALAPVFLLAVGRWFFEPLSLGSDLASPLMAFPCLLLAVIVIPFGERRLAILTAIVAYLTFGGPLLAAWLTDRGVDAFAVMTWNVVFGMSVLGAYIVLLSYRTSMAVTEAREARAWQQASEERRQVARDVHDVLAHTLSVTMLHVTAARMAVLRFDSAQALEALEEAEQHGRSSLTDVRKIVRLLRSDDASALDASQPGLADVENLVAGYRAAGLPIEFSMSVSGGRQSPIAETAMFRVLQEALTNAARYGSGAATVTLSVNDTEMSLAVANPIGKVVPRRTQGSGLLGMRERVTAAGGSFQAGDQRGLWEVHAVVPNGAGG